MGDTEINPMRTIRLVLSYVARWPFRHIYGSAWLSDHFDTVLAKADGKSIREVYGLEYRDNRMPPKINDLFLVSLMQAIILLGLVALSWWAWKWTNDYVLPAFIVFSVFHVIPSEQDFSLHFVVAENPDPEPVDASAWYAVDCPHNLVS